MKKIKFLTILLGFAMFSCINENSEITSTPESNIINADKLEYVGVEHNIMLDEVFEFLENETSKKSYANKTTIDKRKDLQDFLISQVLNNDKYSKYSKGIAIKSMEQHFKENQTNSKHSIYPKSTASSLSDVERQYLDELSNIMNNIVLEQDIISLEQNIIILEKQIEEDDSLSNDQLIILFSATQTAKYTTKYWSENWGKWVNLNPDKSSKWSNLSHKTSNDGHNGCQCEAVGNVAKADVGGAVAGAAYALAVNVIPGAGQAAYGAAIVGNAARASAFAAVYEFFNW